MGEAARRRRAQGVVVREPVVLDTAGGRISVGWDEDEAVTPWGQLGFFAEYLHATGLFERWHDDCPLSYISPNAPAKRDVLGTWLLSILAGHWRYAHVTALRADGVAAALLGMNKVVSEDALRRALQRIAPAAGRAWMQQHLRAAVEPLLQAAWICDIDTTVKPLYGRQEGAVVGYNPSKPGRPSHAVHTYLVSGLRLVLDAEVQAGNRTHGSYSLAGLQRLLDALPAARRPYLVRGDAGLGSETFIAPLEQRGQAYLFKLRLSRGVKRLIEQRAGEADWQDAGGGWQGREERLQLLGWSQARRVVLLRRRVREALVLTQGAPAQLRIGFAEPLQPGAIHEYAVLVTSLPHQVQAVAQLYRDRADAENAFDELKNQWGWGGFSTQDLARCQLSASAVALAYNWWSLFVRLAHPQARLEAITSRPLLLAAVGRQSTHAGQRHLKITSTHGAAAWAQTLLLKARAIIAQCKATAEQLTAHDVWLALCAYLLRVLTPPRTLDQHKMLKPATG